MTYVFLVNGVVKTLQPGFSIKEGPNGRNLFDGRMLSLDGSFRLEVGDAIDLTEDGTRIYGGTIDQPAEAGFGGTGATAAIDLRVSAVDFNEIADRREVTLDIVAGNVKAALVALEPFYDDYGVTLDAGQANGPALPALPYRGEKLRDVLNQISALTNHKWTWEIDYTKVLRFTEIASAATPFDVEDADVEDHVDGDITVEQPTASEYGNFITVWAGTGQQEVTDPFIGNGVTTAFLLRYTLASHRGYITNGVANEPIGVTAPPYWVHDPVAGTITRSSAPANLSAISIIYTAQYPFSVFADGGAIPSLLKEKSYDAPTVFDRTVAQGLADAYLVRDMRVPRTVRYATFNTGIHPGQAQTIAIAKRDLTGLWTITDVEIKNTTGNLAKRFVTAVEGTILPASVGETVMAWGGSSGASAASGTVTVVTSGGVGGAGTAGRVAKWATTTTLTDTTDVPFLSLPNTFSTGQIISGTEAYLYFVESDQGADLKRWRWNATGGVFTLQTINDAATAIQATPLSITRAGALTVLLSVAAPSFSGAGSALTALNASNLASGTVAAARMPALTGDVTSTVGTVATALAAGSASVLNSGNLAYARMPSGSGTWTATPTISGAVTLQSTLGVTGVATFTTHILPATTDTSDIGRYDRIWSQAYISQLNAIVYALNTQTLFGGYSTIGKNAGSFAADVASAATTIDFGQAMTVGHFILVRAHDTVGTIRAEYVTVGSLVSGTTYNVTRDLAAANSPDPIWASGTPYLVLGASGDGRIDLFAYDGKPRIQFVTQGATYNAQTDRVIIGNLNGYYGYATDVYGMAAGLAAGENITIDPTNGVRIRSGTTDYAKMSGTTFTLGAPGGNRVAWDGTDLTVVSGALTIDGTGVHLAPPTTAVFSLTKSFGFTAATGALGLSGYDDTGSRGQLLHSVWTGSGNRPAQIGLLVQAKASPTAFDNAFFNLGATGSSPSTASLFAGTATFQVDALTITGTTMSVGSELRASLITQPSGGFLYPGSASGLGDHQTTFYLASTSAIGGGLLTNSTFDAAGGFVARAGGGGAASGNVFSINWTGAVAQLWIDTSNVGNITLTSDRRVKRNIAPIGVGLAEILRLQPQSFEWLGEKDTPGPQYGLIAQDVAAVLPSITTHMTGLQTDRARDGLWRVDYVALVPVLVRAVQELEAEIADLRKAV